MLNNILSFDLEEWGDPSFLGGDIKGYRKDMGKLVSEAENNIDYVGEKKY